MLNLKRNIINKTNSDLIDVWFKICCVSYTNR